MGPWRWWATGAGDLTRFHSCWNPEWCDGPEAIKGELSLAPWPWVVRMYLARDGWKRNGMLEEFWRCSRVENCGKRIERKQERKKDALCILLSVYNSPVLQQSSNFIANLFSKQEEAACCDGAAPFVLQEDFGFKVFLQMHWGHAASVWTLPLCGDTWFQSATAEGVGGVLDIHLYIPLFCHIKEHFCFI